MHVSSAREDQAAYQADGLLLSHPPNPKPKNPKPKTHDDCSGNPGAGGSFYCTVEIHTPSEPIIWSQNWHPNAISKSSQKHTISLSSEQWNLVCWPDHRRFRWSGTFRQERHPLLTRSCLFLLVQEECRREASARPIVATSSYWGIVGSFARCPLWARLAMLAL